jgi:hypothetical protein
VPAAVILVALAAVIVIVLRDADRPGAYSTVVSAPPGAIAPTFVGAAPVRFSVTPATVKGRGVFFAQVGTYVTAPVDTITLAILDGAGRKVARCVFPPSTYHDNSSLACPVPDIARVRAVRVTRGGKAPIALTTGGGFVGYLQRDEPSSLTGRIRTVLSRLATGLPDGVGAVVLLVALLASIILTGLGLALATGWRSGDPPASSRAMDLPAHTPDGDLPTGAES